ncbi:MAG: carbohydrate kinase [Clostridiaceae bacterium]|nr:carbohydrate kinase [Clostridiaceae bacterium]
MFDLASMGELLVDFTQSGYSQSKMRLFEQNPGGAVANVVCAAARLGLKTAFLGKVGKDSHGRFLADVLNEQGVDTSGLVFADDVFTTLAFVSLDINGEREFAFARKPGADMFIKASDLKTEILTSCKVFHVGSLSMTDEPARGATLHAVMTAKKAGAHISYDPNYRASLWSSEAEARKQMRSLLPYVDFVKISQDEAELLTGYAEPEKALDALLKRDISIAVVTLGEKGAMLGVEGTRVLIPAFRADRVVDTTGAGDAFWGAFLYCIIKESPLIHIPKQLTEYVRFANAAAMLCVGKRGAIPALPDLQQINELLVSAQE